MAPVAAPQFVPLHTTPSLSVMNQLLARNYQRFRQGREAKRACLVVDLGVKVGGSREDTEEAEGEGEEDEREGEEEEEKKKKKKSSGKVERKRKSVNEEKAKEEQGQVKTSSSSSPPGRQAKKSKHCLASRTRTSAPRIPPPPPPPPLPPPPLPPAAAVAAAAAAQRRQSYRLRFRTTRSPAHGPLPPHPSAQEPDQWVVPAAAPTGDDNDDDEHGPKATWARLFPHDPPLGEYGGEPTGWMAKMMWKHGAWVPRGPRDTYVKRFLGPELHAVTEREWAVAVERAEVKRGQVLSCLRLGNGVAVEAGCAGGGDPSPGPGSNTGVDSPGGGGFNTGCSV